MVKAEVVVAVLQGLAVWRCVVVSLQVWHGMGAAEGHCLPDKLHG